MTTAADTITSLLAANVHRYRENAGLSQAELGEKADLSGPSVSHIEQGRRQAPLGTVERIADALGVSVRALLLPPECLDCGDLPRPGYRCVTCGQGERRAS